MATITGTLRGVKVLQTSFSGIDDRILVLLTYDFAAYTGATDDMTVTGVGAAVEATLRDGKTATLRSALCAFPGKDTNGQSVYTGALTVSTDALTGNLAVAAGTEITSTTASQGVGIVAALDMS